jgi:atypical dual specificity phosphatase
MMPYEHRFLAWLLNSRMLSADRLELAQRIGLPGGEDRVIERRMLDIYKKFRDIWQILDRFQEGFGEGGKQVDRFVLSQTLLHQDLAFLKSQGVDVLITLTETPIEAAVIAEFGFETLHLPIVDKKAPTVEQIDKFVSFLDAQLGAGNCILVHCLGGYGRTGTLLVCYLIYCGARANEALAEMRRMRPGSVETDEQEAAIFAYEERVNEQV